MQTVILAGGLGSRLSEETSVKPKPLVEIGSMPILWHIMKYYTCFGINNFIICLGYKGNMIKEFFSDYFKYSNDMIITEKKQLLIGTIIQIIFLNTNQRVPTINKNTPNPKTIISLFIKDIISSAIIGIPPKWILPISS